MPKLDYYNRGDKGLSYSRLKLLNSCARKYELETFYYPQGDYGTTPTFAFGHVVAGIVQGWFVHKDANRAIAHGTRLWDLEIDHDYSDRDWKSKKTFYHAVQAGQEFISQIVTPDTELYEAFDGWELAIFRYNGRVFNGEELTFVLELDNDYTYEGHIDLVLWNPELQRFKVIEIKTTSYREPDDALYIHSEQAIGYTILLDHAASVLGISADTAYDVTYLIYSTGGGYYSVRNYHKTAQQRQQWLNWLAYQVTILELYRDGGVEYPTNGGSCYQWNRACKYIDQCHLSNDVQVANPLPDTYETLAAEDVDFMFKFDDIVNTQMEKLAASPEIITTSNSTVDVAELLP